MLAKKILDFWNHNVNNPYSQEKNFQIVKESDWSYVAKDYINYFEEIYREK